MYRYLAMVMLPPRVGEWLSGMCVDALCCAFLPEPLICLCPGVIGKGLSAREGLLCHLMSGRERIKRLFVCMAGVETCWVIPRHPGARSCWVSSCNDSTTR